MVPRFIYNHIVTKIRERPIRIGRIQQQNQDNSNNPDAIPKNENNQPIYLLNISIPLADDSTYLVDSLRVVSNSSK